MKKISILEIQQKISNVIEKNYKIIFLIILIIGISLNVYKFGDIPKYLNYDEGGTEYDAYCIANYGVDRYLNKFPVYFVNYGDGQNALYAYLAAIVIKIFGMSQKILRIPALVLSIIEIITAYFLVKEFKGKKQGLLFMLLVTIMPWHIMKSRWALESYLLSPMLLFSVYSLTKAVKKQKWYIYSISGLLFGLTLYSYAVSFIVIPIFLLFMIIYLLRKKLVNLKQIIAFCIPLLIFAIPLIMLILVQKDIIPPIDSFISIVKLPKYRENDISIKNILSNIKQWKYVFYCDTLSYNSIKGFGTFYLYGVIFIIIGFIKAVYDAIYNRKKFKFDLDVVMIFYFVANIILGLLISSNGNRLNGIYIPATYFILKSLEYFYKQIIGLFYITIITFFVSLGLFTNVYFNEYANAKYSFFDNGSMNLISYLNKYEGNEIYFVTNDKVLWTYELIVNEDSPYYLNQTKTATILTQDFNYGKYHNHEDTTKKLLHDFNKFKVDMTGKTVYVVENNYSQYIEELKKDGFKYEIYQEQYYIFYMI